MFLKASALVCLALVAYRVEALTLTTLSARTTTDICANVDAQLELPGIALPAGVIDICLCLNDIPNLLTTNPILVAAVDLTNVAVVTAALTTMVTDAADHKTCTFPEHSEPVCSASNPCGFQCTDGYMGIPLESPNPTDCACPSPWKVCNGVCGFVAGICPTNLPKKREAAVLQRRAETSCDAGYTACGVYGWQGFASANAWECIDTRSDLESCGGCIIPFGRNPARGIDCTAIPGVMDVACSAGSCVISRCLSGWDVSFDGSYCIHKNAGDAMAAMYGLEHVPLKRDA